MELMLSQFKSAFVWRNYFFRPEMTRRNQLACDDNLELVILNRLDSTGALVLYGNPSALGAASSDVLAFSLR